MKLSQALEVSPPDRKHQVKGIKKHMAQKKGKDKIPKTYVDKKTGKRKKTTGCRYIKSHGKNTQTLFPG